jgi:hypothetical protein
MMFHFRTLDDGVIAALEMPEALSAAELPPADRGLPPNGEASSVMQR